MTEERIERLLRETEFSNEGHKEFLRKKLQSRLTQMDERLIRMKELFADAKLVKEMAAAGTVEEAKVWFAAHGVELTMDEVAELGKAFVNAEKVELRLDELENVAAGRANLELRNAEHNYFGALVDAVVNNDSFSICISPQRDSIRDMGEEKEKLAINWTKPKKKEIGL